MHRNLYEIPVDVGSVDQDVKLVQGHKAPTNPVIIVPHCSKLYSPAPTSSLRSLLTKKWINTHCWLIQCLLWRYGHPVHIINSYQPKRSVGQNQKKTK